MEATVVSELIQSSPQIGLAGFVIWVGYKLFERQGTQIAEMNKSLARIATLLETLTNRRGV